MGRVTMLITSISYRCGTVPVLGSNPGGTGVWPAISEFIDWLNTNPLFPEKIL